MEWSFPIQYKQLNFDKPIPETQALMKIIDDKKPSFIYSLHNAGFGGCYWYLTDGDQPLYDQLYKAPAQEKIPLSLGEPEVPWCKELAPAIYKMVGVIDHYNYLEEYMPGQSPTTLITSGTSSDEYANRAGKVIARALINEMPYFYCSRVDDTTLTTRSRMDCLLECCDESERSANLLAQLYGQVKDALATDNPFMVAVADRVITNNDFAVKREWARNTPEFKELATVCQEFDSVYQSRFYQNLHMALLYRGCLYELDKNPGLTAQQKETLARVSKEAEAQMMESCKFLESHIQYTAIPIQKLVKIQLASGLIYAQYAHKKALEG